MYFHLLFRFCVDLGKMVNIMQNHAKIEQKDGIAENPCKAMQHADQSIFYLNFAMIFDIFIRLFCMKLCVFTWFLVFILI